MRPVSKYTTIEHRLKTRSKEEEKKIKNKFIFVYDDVS